MEHQIDYNVVMPAYVSHKSRLIEMTRHKGLSYGFAIRGGREHGTGVFVSEVEPGSEAFTKGLKVGDQILRVNGFCINEAIHEEVINLLKSKNSLHLKVKSIGLIPVKKCDTDIISWKTVDANENSVAMHHRKTSSSASTHSGDFMEFRVILNVGARRSFGCNICKGPADHPGIFIQTIKEGGLAYVAGLRPGDQLLEANGRKLNDVEFNEAVEFLKSFDQVELLVRKGVGAYLFPGESSGYNSSNSSVNDDNGTEEYHSPLPAVTEEELVGASMEGTTGKSLRPCSNDANDEEDNINERKVLSQLDDVIAANQTTIKTADCKQYDHLTPMETTSTKVAEEDFEEILRNVERVETGINRSRTLSDSGDETNKSLTATPCRKQGDRWQKTILAEVHNTPSPCKLNNSKVGGSSEDHWTVPESDENDVVQTETGAKKPVSVQIRNLSEDLQQKNQHDQLIEEFKKVHQKMLAQQELDDQRVKECSNAKEKTIKIVEKVQMKPVSILKKSAPVKRRDESPTEKSTSQMPNINRINFVASTKTIRMPAIVSPVIEKKELEKVLKNLKRTSNGLQMHDAKNDNLDHQNQSIDVTNKTTATPILPDVVAPTKTEISPIPSTEKLTIFDVDKSSTNDSTSIEIMPIKNGKTKAITDSSLRIPKPPNTFFPKSKTPVQVIVQSYQSGSHQLTPSRTNTQRFDFLKSQQQKSIEIEQKIACENSTPSKTTTGVTKIVVNKSPNVQSVSTIEEPITSNNVRETIEKFKATENGIDQVKRLEKPTWKIGNIHNGKSHPEKTVIANTTNNVTNKPKISLMPMKTSIDVKSKPRSDENKGDNDRLSRRQRIPTVGDHKVSIQIQREPVLIISSQQ